MTVSFIVSTYEYNDVHSQYLKQFQIANANFGNMSHETLVSQVAEATLNQTLTSARNQSDLQTSLLKMVKEASERVNYAIDYVSKSDINTFENQIMNTTQYGEPLLRFALTIIISLGAIFKLCYQTYGMTSLPIFLIKGTRSLEDENDEIQGSIGSVRE